jgi:hypothetical protein
MLNARRIIHLLCVFLSSTFAAGTALAWDYTVSVSGNTINVSISGMKDTSGSGCCAGAGSAPGGASCSIPCGNQTATLTCNRQGANTIFVYAADDTTRSLPGGPYEMRVATVNVADPPPPTCPAFSFFAVTHRAITHKYGTEPWVTGQSRDAQVELMFRPVRIEAGTQIYLRVTDPRDPSTYKPAATTPGPDNIDTGAGKLALSPSDSGATTLTFTAPTDGNQTIYLNTTGFAGGDNYVVQATPDPQLLGDPNFVCGPTTNCQASAPVTAWKRVYLEKKRMFRSGLFVAQLAPAGTNQVVVQIPEGKSWRHVRLNAGDPILLMHAKRLDGLDFSGFYSEDSVVAAVDRVPGARNRRLLTLTAPLAHSYDRDETYAQSLTDGVSDGVGNVAAGLFGQYTGLLTSTFGDAFVEFRDLEQSVTEIPYVPVVRQPHRIANKWFEHTTVGAVTLARPGDSNVKHVLAGSGVADPNGGRGISLFEYGETGLYVTASSLPQIPEPNYSWTWAQAIEEATGRGGPLAGLDPVTVQSENAVHELAHGFNVNSVYYFGGDYGHCGSPMANDHALNCLMMAHDHPSFSIPQKGDGKVGFHYNSDSDSEYMTIRRQMEPFPTPMR